MKLYRFSEKLPELGSNILVIHENDGMIGITPFNLEIRRLILSNCDSERHQIELYSDDSQEDRCSDLRIDDYWSYPSSIKLPKKK